MKHNLSLDDSISSPLSGDSPYNTKTGLMMPLDIDTTRSTKSQSISFSRIMDRQALQESIMHDPEDSFQGIKVFPVFEYQKLKSISNTYALYLEIFKLALFISAIVLGILLLIEFICDFVIDDPDENLQSNPYILWIKLLLCLVSVRSVRYFREVKLAKSESMYLDDWTEDKFSLLIGNLPQDVTKEEIKEFIDRILITRGVTTTLKDIIFLQDCRKYMEFKSELEKRSKENPDNIKSFFDKLLRNDIKDYKNFIAKLENVMREIENEAQENKLFLGKAIIIFDTVKAKIVLKRYLPNTTLGIFLHKVFWFYRKNARIRGHLIEGHKISEPKDIFYWSFSFTKLQKYTRFVIINLPLLGLLGAGIFFITQFAYSLNCIELQLNGINLDKTGCTTMDISNFWLYLYSYSYILVILLIGKAMESCYRRLNGYLIHPSESIKTENYLRYCLVMNYANYILAFAYVLYLEQASEIAETFFVDRIIWTIAFLFVKRLIVKIYRLNVIKRLQRKRLKENPNLMNSAHENVLRALNEHESFDFIGGLTDFIPAFFLILGYMTYDIWMVPIGMVSLYLMALVDKYIILRYTVPFEIKSFEYGMNFLRPFKWDLRIMLVPIIAYLYWLDNRKYSNSTYTFYGILIFGGILVFDLVSPSLDLKSRIRKNFNLKNAEIQYDSVSHLFVNKYRDEYPFGFII